MPVDSELRFRRRRRVVLVLLVLAVAFVVWRAQPPEPVPKDESLTRVSEPVVTTSENPVPPSPAPADSADAARPETASKPKLDPRFFGSWKDQFYGERTMTFREDGTGTMRIELEPISRAIYGPEITFNFRWTYDGDALHLEMIDGEPKAAAETLSKLFGKTSDRRIELLTDDELHMRSLDSHKLYQHRRAKASGGT